MGIKDSESIPNFVLLKLLPPAIAWALPLLSYHQFQKLEE